MSRLLLTILTALVLGLDNMDLDIFVKGDGCSCCDGGGCEMPGCTCGADELVPTCSAPQKSCCKSAPTSSKKPAYKRACPCGGHSGWHLLMGQKLSPLAFRVEALGDCTHHEEGFEGKGLDPTSHRVAPELKPPRMESFAAHEMGA